MIFLLQAPTDSMATGAIAVLSGLVDRVLDYAILLAAVGAVSMALIEVVKKLFDFRARFHAERWTDFMIWNDYTPSKEPDETDTYVQLLQLACGVGAAEASQAVWELTGGAKPRPQPRIDRRTAQAAERFASREGKRLMIPTFWGQPKPAYAVFAQSTAQVVTTLGDAADIALASPYSYPALFEFLVSGARLEDIQCWVESTEEGAAGSPNETPEEKRNRAVGQREAAGALSRLRQVSRRRLAAFRLFTEQSWASWNQLWANAVGVIVMAIVLIPMKMNPILTLVGALFGGLLAPVAKDLVDALQKVKSDIKEA